MNIKPPIRPQKTIDRLIDVLEPHATPVNAIARKRLTWEYKRQNPALYFLKKASCRLFVIPTGY
ncbi:FIG00732169: hypothetical protein [Klebsiella pneumoniae IS46]|nr:FIG00732169: hypothetical protein [Klebsiella pneumoniae IS46]